MMRVIVFLSLIVAVILAAPATAPIEHQAQMSSRGLEELMQGGFLADIEAWLANAWSQLMQALPPRIAELCM
jgi:hypothetical protein